MTLLERIWWSSEPGFAGALASAPLSLAAAAFRAGAALRNGLYDAGLLRSIRAAVPVVSLGNVAVGGAGKTPAAIAVARRLLARGLRVAVLSRGYGATRGDARVVSDGARVLLSAAEAGDEPALIARRLPGVAVLCGPRRADLARTAVEVFGAGALVLDDGFQHRALARDLDVAVLDAASPFGNGRLLPAGPLREGRSALRRADLVWLSRVDQADDAAVSALRSLAREASGRDAVESRHAPVDVLDGALARSFGRGALEGRRVLLLAGIARPEGFRRTLAAMGAEVLAERLFPDHHPFSPSDASGAFRDAEDARCDLVVTTEKDAVRLPPGAAAHERLRAVRIEAEIVRGGEVLDEAIDEALRERSASPAPPSTTAPPSTPARITTATTAPTTTPTTATSATASAARTPSRPR